MANKLNIDKKTMITAMLCEGNSIRGVERMTGVHRDTTMRLGVRMGQGCQKIMDQRLRGLHSRHIEVDELWGFIGMKRGTANRKRVGSPVGDVWTWVAIDADSKLVPAFAVGDRSQYMANVFIEDLASRLSHRIQISTDALSAYRGAIDRAFGGDVDYGLLVKTYSTPAPEAQRTYSPPRMVRARRESVQGNPDRGLICTSHIEKQNHHQDALSPPWASN